METLGEWGWRRGGSVIVERGKDLGLAKGRPPGSGQRVGFLLMQEVRSDMYVEDEWRRGGDDGAEL
jgi:hypothetical protein